MIDSHYKWFCLFNLLWPHRTYRVCLVFWCLNSVNSCFCLNGLRIVCLSRTAFLVVSLLGAGNSRMWDYHSNTLLSKLFWRAIGLNASYYNRNTPHFPNHTSRAMKVFIHNWIQDERASRYCYKMRGLFVHKVVPKSSEKWTSHEANSKLFVNIFPSVESYKNILMITSTIASVQRQNMLVHLSLELSVL